MSSASFPEGANAHSPYVILAALSSDESGEFALLEAARTAAARPDSELHIVHVVREDDAADSGADLRSLERRLASAPATLEQQVARLQEILPARVTAHVRAGQPARSILQTAVDVNADLIVIGTHHRNRIEAIINGSVVERVLHDAHCPVLVAVPKNYDGEMKSQSIEPPCPDCIVARQQSHNQTFWCERHSRAYNQPHVYEPHDRGRAVAVMPGH
jgi:nucleotide-binding universal stress UspA family protein